MEPRLRASFEQFSALVEFMERHGDLSRPQGGPQGRLKGERLWQELTSLLNSIGGGVIKSQDKWKKVWSDFKTKAKKKYMLLRRHASGTGGGPSSRQTLTALEERTVSLMGVSAAVGQASIQELGFNSTSEPSQQVAESEVEESYDVEIFEEIPDVLPSTSRTPQPPAWTPPSPAPATSPTEPQPSASRGQSQRSPPPRQSQSQASPTRQHQSQPSPPRHQPQPSPPRRRQPQPSAPRRQPHSTPSRRGRQPPLNIEQVSASPETTPRRRRLQLSARRNRGLTPFDRAASEFAAVEQRRLQLEETRERYLHERELERIVVSRERNQIAREHNLLLQQLGVIAERMLGVLTQNRPSNSLASTDILPE